MGCNVKLKKFIIYTLTFFILMGAGVPQIVQVHAKTQRIIYSNGDVYTGSVTIESFDEDEPEVIKNGKGIYKCKNGTKITGIWTDDYLNGSGKIVYKNKEKYIGKFKQDQKSGTGKYYFKNGDIYNGKWKKDKMHGKGKYKFKKGMILAGTWKNGYLQGKCTFTTKKYIYKIGMKKGKLKKIYSWRKK